MFGIYEFQIWEYESYGGPQVTETPPSRVWGLWHSHFTEIACLCLRLDGAVGIGG